MRRIKSFVLNLRDITDRYIRENFRKVEDRINELEDKVDNGGTASTTVINTVSSSSSSSTKTTGTTIEKTPQASISALKCVRANSPDTILECNPNGSYFEAVVLGIITRTGINGVLAPVQVYGEFKDPFLDFPLNDTLYLGSDGSITNTAPTSTTHLTIIGYSLGTGSIFINIQEPIQQN